MKIVSVLNAFYEHLNFNFLKLHVKGRLAALDYLIRLLIFVPKDIFWLINMYIKFAYDALFSIDKIFAIFLSLFSISGVTIILIRSLFHPMEWCAKKIFF